MILLFLQDKLLYLRAPLIIDSIVLLAVIGQLHSKIVISSSHGKQSPQRILEMFKKMD